MKIPFRPRTRIILGLAIVPVAFIMLFGMQKSCAYAEDAPVIAAAENETAGTPAEAAPDLTPDTVLLKLAADESQPPLEITLKQLMETFKVPGLSVAVIDNYQIAWAKGFGV